ncbi:MAG TPA: 16S rRNA (cytosine(1402)-N(4))-methyltransferase RsmH [Opitutales bacterium]|nr:16S rRNA (cytosine(1402)-N(4))-methyltransferase RsmH [Opitutales bacterium]
MSSHLPVLPQEVLSLLEPKAGELFLDATFGGGGHTRLFLESGVDVVAIDRDPEAEVRASLYKEEWGDRFEFFRLNFDQIDQLPQERFDGIFLDIGVSSFQLDEAERGFSFRSDAPADMRMDPDSGIPASQWLEEASEQELIEAVRNYGEEREWRRVVRAIIAARGSSKLGRTASLAELVASAKTARARRESRIHPATKTFQGIRIALNDELGALERLLPKAFAKLNPGGRLAVISFHSLEDRIVKRYFRQLCGQPVDARDHTPQQLREKVADALTNRPVRATAEEIEKNPRSRSARLRAIQKLEVIS